MKTIILKKAKNVLKADESISLNSLSSVEIEELEIGTMPYNLNLNELGHKYDEKISTGLKIAAAAAAVAAVAATAGAAAPAAAGAAETVAGTARTAVVEGAKKTAVMEGSKMMMAMSKVKKSAEFADKVRDKYDEIELKDHEKDKGGAFESFVGLITDRTLGKPQRRRAIHQYLDSTLMPSYKQELGAIANSIVCAISDAISAEVENNLNELTSALSSIQEVQRNNELEYKSRINHLKQYRNEIINS